MRAAFDGPTYQQRIPPTRHPMMGDAPKSEATIRRTSLATPSAPLRDLGGPSTDPGISDARWLRLNALLGMNRRTSPRPAAPRHRLAAGRIVQPLQGMRGYPPRERRGAS